MLVLGTACKRDFNIYYEKARREFHDQNYINTIDSINIGLLHWRDYHGEEKKAQAYQLLGQAYHHLRNMDKAMEAYREAVRLSTNTFPSAYELGMMYLTKNQPERAMDAFQKALKMKTDDPMALLGLANSYFALRRYKDAQFTYQRIVDVSPGVRDALEALTLIKNKTAIHPRAGGSSSPGYKPPARKSDSTLILKRSGKK